ncbi:MAG: glutamine-hydrolyzing carbamoyl-phosphate synthase small subunit [Gammaproteobacteria bacterium]|nr:glutamine-hydrolyzing carbamoyl-phosphate synthase small subunit [Gammaproteobacteria bacterium]
MVTDAVLALADGTTFRGRSIGAAGKTSGEVVFNTALTGYQEILSDPSYCQQIVTLTYPHIGNVGANADDMESRRAFAAGLVVRDLPPRASNYRMQQTLQDFLQHEGVVAIADIDTRKLTRILRERGAQSGCIAAAVAGAAVTAESIAALEHDALAGARGFPGIKGMDLAKVVCVAERYEWRDGSRFDAPPAPAAAGRPLRVVAYDFGVKYNILRLLVDAGCEVTVVPAQTPASAVLALAPEGVFLSNGPGDPEPCDYAIAAIRELLERDLPIFGICLGHQLLGLASGARTVKMKFGHHGANHPVQDLDSGRVLITSQNHGFAIDETSLPSNLRATHRSLFDGTLQGVARTDRDAFSFQGHPEASPGPHDVKYLFERFTAAMQRRRGG